MCFLYLMSQRSSFNPEKKSKSSIFGILTMSGPYGLYMCALETYVCSWDMGYAVWTWDMSSCWIMVGTVEPSMYQWIRLDYNALLEWITRLEPPQQRPLRWNVFFKKYVWGKLILKKWLYFWKLWIFQFAPKPCSRERRRFCGQFPCGNVSIWIFLINVVDTFRFQLQLSIF